MLKKTDTKGEGLNDAEFEVKYYQEITSNANFFDILHDELSDYTTCWNLGDSILYLEYLILYFNIFVV